MAVQLATEMALNSEVGCSGVRSSHFLETPIKQLLLQLQLQFRILGIWDLGNLGSQEFGALGIWEFGNFTNWEFCNLGSWEFGIIGIWDLWNLGC